MAWGYIDSLENRIQFVQSTTWPLHLPVSLHNAPFFSPFFTPLEMGGREGQNMSVGLVGPRTRTSWEIFRGCDPGKAQPLEAKGGQCLS